MLCGFERTGRSLRTRQNTRKAMALAARGNVTTQDLVDTLFSNESLSGEMLRDEVVERCRAAGVISIDGVAVDVGRAAEVLGRWDLRVGLDSIGAALWREFMAGFKLGADDSAWRNGGTLFAAPFDPDHPIESPHTLAGPTDSGLDAVALTMAAAIRSLEAAGIALDTPLGEVQWAVRGASNVPLPGGGEGEGVMNVAWPIETLQRLSLEPAPEPLRPVAGRQVSSGLGDGGYQIRYGASFVMVVELTDAGPAGFGLLAYGQTSNPSSPHHSDGTVAFASGHLRRLLFSDADIESDPNLVRRHLTR